MEFGNIIGLLLTRNLFIWIFQNWTLKIIPFFKSLPSFHVERYKQFLWRHLLLSRKFYKFYICRLETSYLLLPYPWTCYVCRLTPNLRRKFGWLRLTYRDEHSSLEVKVSISTGSGLIGLKNRPILLESMKNEHLIHFQLDFEV